MEKEFDSPKPPVDGGADNPLVDAALGELADLDIPDDDNVGHDWVKESAAEECGDCGTMCDTWCKNCEACKNCHDRGRCQPCQPIGEEV